MVKMGGGEARNVKVRELSLISTGRRSCTVID